MLLQGWEMVGNRNFFTLKMLLNTIYIYVQDFSILTSEIVGSVKGRLPIYISLRVDSWIQLR